MTISITSWRPRSTPLEAKGLLVRPQQRYGLIKRLEQWDRKKIRSLRGSYNQEVVVLLSTDGELPWIPGADYLGQDAIAPHLWLPTHLHPDVPLDLVDKAMVQHYGEKQFVLNPWHKQFYCTTDMQALDPDHLGVLTP